jgi:hypothetical protein
MTVLVESLDLEIGEEKINTKNLIIRLRMNITNETT